MLLDSVVRGEAERLRTHLLGPRQSAGQEFQEVRSIHLVRLRTAPGGWRKHYSNPRKSAYLQEFVEAEDICYPGDLEGQRKVRLHNGRPLVEMNVCQFGENDSKLVKLGKLVQ